MIKRIKIYKNQIGLVFKSSQFNNAITEGTHWFFRNELVRIYDKTTDFALPCNLDILLENQTATDALEVIEVADHEVVFMYINGNFNRVLSPGRYAFWKSVIKREFRRFNTKNVEIGNQIEREALQKIAVRAKVAVQTVANHEKGLLFVDGKFIRELAAGEYFFWKNGQTVEVLKADLRTQQMEISGQEILTKDKAALRINFFLQFTITDIQKALVDNKNMSNQLYLLMQMAIREYVGTRTLDELLAKKEAIKDFVLAETAEKAVDFGVKIKSCGIRDVILPGEVKDIMNQVLIAEKTAQANTIMRREETASTRSLLNTAKLMEDNAMLMKLKEMEYVEKVADKINNITVAGGGQILEQLKELLV